MKKTKKDTFHAAILRSLRALVDSGEVITNTAVIENAKYLDGRQVGKSTLYSLKRGQKGVYVHSDLLVTLDTARDEQLKGKGKSTKKETIASVKKESARLRAENKKLVDAVVTQEAALQKANSRITTKERTSASYESDIYTLASLVHHMSSGALEGVSKRVIAFETKERGSAHLKELESNVEELLARISRAKTTPITS